MFCKDDKDKTAHHSGCEEDCNCDHDHECGDDCECEHDHEESSTITLEMEDGTSKDFTILAMLEHKDKKFIALSEVDTMEYDILQLEYADEEAELSEIEDDALFEEVAAKFDEMFQEEDEEEEE